ncbi:Visual system homeobox 2 [Liparis tanakae]|uniref:Visual system homeobox 2 n=1 Tax=Liparis tanakae TaxID=230148 RepID=A0A4Z2JBD4_9TELE|nr:Visual system homeobox 2 [Liparis tanakae]
MESWLLGVHKKSTEEVVPPATGQCDAAHQLSSQRAEEAKAEEKRSEGKSTMSKEELMRENSIDALRAKAQEHSAKVLGTFLRTDAGQTQERPAAEEKAADPLSPAEEERSP